MIIHSFLRLLKKNTTLLGVGVGVGVLSLCLSGISAFSQKKEAPKNVHYYRVKVSQGEILKINQDSLFVHHKDTTLLIPKGTAYEFIEKDQKIHQEFYDSLKIKYGKNKISDLLLSNLLVNTDTSKKYQKKQLFIKSEEEFLPFKGLIIDKIILKKVSLMTGSVHDTTQQITTWAGRIMGKVHIYSKNRTILNNLLFKSGEQISPHQLADNERLLRSLSFIEDAKILVSKDPITSLATITVITKDVWSVGIAIDVDDIDKYDLEIYDKNFLGQGNEFSNTALINTSQRLIGYNVKYIINNIKRSFINSFLQYKTTYNEDLVRLKFDKRFLTPQTKYGGGLDIFIRSFIEEITTEELEMNEENITLKKQEVWVGRAISLPNSENRSNLLLSIAYVNTNFSTRPPQVADNFYFKYHHQKLFLTKISINKLNYYKTSFINRFGITEDIPIGTLVSFTNGIDFGEFKSRLYFGVSYTKSLVTSRTEYLMGRVSLSSFINENKKEDALFNASILYFSKLNTITAKYKVRYQARLFYTRGFDRVNDEVLSLNRNKGIRGFSEPNLTGEERLSLNLESDVITPWNVYGFKFIPYAFIDISLIGSSRTEELRIENPYSGIGIGIRVRNESLVFSTFEFRIGYYPKVYERSDFYSVDLFANSPFSFQNLNDIKPRVEKLE